MFPVLQRNIPLIRVLRCGSDGEESLKGRKELDSRPLPHEPVVSRSSIWRWRGRDKRRSCIFIFHKDLCFMKRTWLKQPPAVSILTGTWSFFLTKRASSWLALGCVLTQFFCLFFSLNTNLNCYCSPLYEKSAPRKHSCWVCWKELFQKKRVALSFPTTLGFPYVACEIFICCHCGGIVGGSQGIDHLIPNQ